MRGGLLAFILKRVVYAIVSLLFLIVIVFVLINVILPTPIAKARIYVRNPHAPYSELVAIAKQHGFYQPLYVQIADYIWNVLHGNLGIDPVYGVPESSLIMQYLPVTLELVIPATILTVVIGIVMGAISASNRGNWKDLLVKGIYLTSWSSPSFFIATVILLVFAYDLGLFPSSGLVNPLLTPPPNVAGFPIINAIIAGDTTYLISLIRHMVLPVISIALVSFGVITRIARSSLIETLESDFSKLAFMKGRTKSQVTYGVALRNGSLPIVTLVALLFAQSIAGDVVVEDIFDYHGLGYYLLTVGIYQTDYLALLDITLIDGILVIAANLIADILYGVLDPRVRIT